MCSWHWGPGRGGGMKTDLAGDATGRSGVQTNRGRSSTRPYTGQPVLNKQHTSGALGFNRLTLVISSAISSQKSSRQTEQHTSGNRQLQSTDNCHNT